MRGFTRVEMKISALTIMYMFFFTHFHIDS